MVALDEPKRLRDASPNAWVRMFLSREPPSTGRASADLQFEEAEPKATRHDQECEARDG
jgi:hypothetical protein